MSKSCSWIVPVLKIIVWAYYSLKKYQELYIFDRSNNIMGFFQMPKRWVLDQFFSPHSWCGFIDFPITIPYFLLSDLQNISFIVFSQPKPFNHTTPSSLHALFCLLAFKRHGRPMSPDVNYPMLISLRIQTLY